MTPKAKKIPFSDRELAVSAIFAKHDPDNLIKVGAPSDEYDGEARAVCRLITDYSSVGAIAAACFQVWGITMHTGTIGDTDEVWDRRDQRKDKVDDWVDIAEDIKAMLKEKKT